MEARSLAKSTADMILGLSFDRPSIPLLFAAYLYRVRTMLVAGNEEFRLQVQMDRKYPDPANLL